MKKFFRRLWQAVFPVYPPYSPCCTEQLRWLGPEELLARAAAKGISPEQFVMRTLYLGSLYECPACEKVWEYRP